MSRAIGNDIIKMLRGDLLTFVLMFLLSLTLILIYAFNMEDKYTSEIKIVALEEGGVSGLGGIVGQFGGLANLAGVSLQGKSDVNLLIETIESRDFLKLFIKDNNLSVPLMAAKGWDSNTNKLVIDTDIYDINNEKWVRKVDDNKKRKPSLEEQYQAFIKILNVRVNKKTNLITIELTYYSPFISRDWLNSLTLALSDFLRRKEKNESLKVIEFINKEYRDVKNIEIKKTMSEILQEEYKKVVLSEAGENYAFEVRDKAYIPEEKSSPNRKVWLILGIFFSLFFSFFCVLLRLYYRNIKCE